MSLKQTVKKNIIESGIQAYYNRFFIFKIVTSLYLCKSVKNN
jgi:hypothetical protein